MQVALENPGFVACHKRLDQCVLQRGYRAVDGGRGLDRQAGGVTRWYEAPGEQHAVVDRLGKSVGLDGPYLAGAPAFDQRGVQRVPERGCASAVLTSSR